jgi:glycosyltransferase involved in cell wall biosynthesis
MVMAESPFLSIITASLNNRRTIGSTLESVRSQRFHSFEHIVCDGGSTDGTLDVLREFEDRYNLSWSSGYDRGISDAMNKGLQTAKGKYIIVIQADDVLIDSDVFSFVSSQLITEDHDICSFEVIRDRPPFPPFRYRPIKIPWWYHFKHTIPHQGAFVHRRLFERIGGFREQFSIAMDYDFFYRAFRDRATIRYFHRPVSRMGGYGISSQRQVLLKRLDEEKQVQELNEKSLWWRTAQKAFRSLYLPYKTRCLKRPRPTDVRAEPRFPS